MTGQPSSLSRVGFDRLIERAIKLDEAGNERIDLERARAIADELGIKPAAWDAALRERESSQQAERAQRTGRPLRRRVSIVALVGVVAGGLSGSLAGQLADGVLILGGVAVAAGVALVVDGIRRRSVRSTQIEVAAWWLSTLAGIVVGMRGLHPDPLVFTGVAWAGCAALGFTHDRLLRRALASPPLPDTPTA